MSTPLPSPLLRRALGLACALLACAAATTPLAAQELRATVTVNAPQLTIIDPGVIQEFEVAVREFLNNTRFTDTEYEDEERIECNLTFSITKETSASQFSAELLVQQSRPVYGSDYTTTVFNYLDKPTEVIYQQFGGIEFSRENFTSALGALLTYYAYVIIGNDLDTFAPLGGEEMYKRAELVMNNVPDNVSNVDKGWAADGTARSRFRLMRELRNPRARAYRQMMYDYHRRGLDVMAGDPVAGRAVMAKSLEGLTKVRDDIPNAILLTVLSSSKAQELVDVFTPAPQAERQAVYGVMASIDPSNINKFRAIR